MNRDAHVSIDWTWEDEDNHRVVELEVTATVTAYDPGVTSGPPERCYPPEGGDVEDIEATALSVATYRAYLQTESHAEVCRKAAADFIKMVYGVGRDKADPEAERVEEALREAACDD